MIIISDTLSGMTPFSPRKRYRNAFALPVVTLPLCGDKQPTPQSLVGAVKLVRRLKTIVSVPWIALRSKKQKGETSLCLVTVVRENIQNFTARKRMCCGVTLRKAHVIGFVGWFPFISP